MVDRFAGDSFDFSPEGEILLAGYRPINPRAFKGAGRRDLKRGPKPGRGPMTPEQRARILRKNRVLNDALQREREAFGNPDDPQIDGVPESLTRNEMDNRFKGLQRKPKPFNPKKELEDYRKDMFRLGKKARDNYFKTTLNDRNLELEDRAALQTATNKADILNTSDQDYLRERMRNWWNSKMITAEARLRKGERMMGLNRDGTFKIKGGDGAIRNDDLQREGFGELKMLTNEMYPRGAFGDFTNQELYRWNTEKFAPKVDPGAATELVQPISPLDDQYRESGMFPPL